VRWGKVVSPGTISAVAVTPSGNVTVAGSIAGRTGLACGQNDPTVSTAAAASFAPTDGHCRWASSLNSSASISGQALALGSSDVVYVSGTFQTFEQPPPDFGGGPLKTLNTTEPTPYVAAFVDSGTGLNHVWSTSFPGNAYVRGMSGGTSPVIAGHYYSCLDVGGKSPASFCPTTSQSMFAVSVTATGTPDWVVGGVDTVQRTGMAMAWGVAESNKVVYVGGTAESGVTFGTTTLTAQGLSDAYVAAYDKLTGGPLWIKNWGASTSRNKVQRLLAEPSGGVVVAGTAYGGTDFGKGPIGTGQPMQHLFVMRLSESGEISNFTSLYVGLGSAYGLGRLLDGRIVLFGTYYTNLSLAGKTLVPEASGDPFFMVLSKDLSQIEYAESFTTPGEDFYPGQLAISPLDDSIAIGVNFQNSITVRCQTFAGATGWNGLVTVLELPK
jgi:hypothetical protein